MKRLCLSLSPVLRSRAPFASAFASVVASGAWLSLPLALPPPPPPLPKSPPVAPSSDLPLVRHPPHQNSRWSQLSSTLGFLGQHRLVPFANNITIVLGCYSVFFHDTIVAAVLSPCRTSPALCQPLPSPFDATPSPLIAERSRPCRRVAVPTLTGACLGPPTS